MPVFEQGYRKYVGEKSTRSRAFAIAWESVRTRMRWWIWVMLFFLLFWPYLIHAVTIFMATLGAGLFGGPRGVASTVKDVAFEQDGGRGGVQIGTLLAMMQGNSLKLFWSLLNQSTFATIVVPAVACAGLLASDRRTGALQIYFARPVSRLDYLAGKVLAATFFVALTTAIPCLLIWIETVAFGSTSTFTWKTWIAPLVIVGSSSFYALWVVALLLSLSSVMRRPAFVAITAIVVFLALQGIGAILADTLPNSGLGKGWHVISPSYAIGSMTAPLCGLSLPDWINGPLACGIAVGLPLLLLGHVWWRLRAVEVST